MTEREKRLYLASSIDNMDRVKTLVHVLSRHGWRLTHDWTMDGVIEDDHLRAAYAVAQMQGVLRADVVGFLLPGGRGAHAEIGAAIATNKPVILFADNFELLKGSTGRLCNYYRHPLVHTVGNQDEFLQVAELLFQSRL